MNTNVFGTLQVTQAFLPQFRARKAGTIINVSSSVTLKPIPLVGMYRASKAALNAWTESLAIEAKPFGIRVHIVLPGRSPETQFGQNARSFMYGQDDPDYGEMVQSVVASMLNSTKAVTHAEDVANAIWTVATETKSPLYTVAGADSQEWLEEAVANPVFISS